MLKKEKPRRSGGSVATRLFLVAHRGQQGQERAAVRIAQCQPRYRVVGGFPIGRSAHLRNPEESSSDSGKPARAAGFRRSGRSVESVRPVRQPIEALWLDAVPLLVAASVFGWIVIGL